MAVVEALDIDEETKELFKAFIANNPEVVLKKLTFDGKSDGDIRVEGPWGDLSLDLFLFHMNVHKAANLLNSVKLPRLLSAIHHLEDNLLEVIWTARRLADNRHDVKDRSFAFKYKDIDYSCRFGEASEHLLFISDCAIFRQSSSTIYRNLSSFKAFQEESSELKKARDFGKPRSFYISSFDLDEEESVEFLQHLNFYMSYYDSETPTVLLHLSESSKTSFNRYVRGDFPSIITARPLDTNLLSFWGAMRTSNPMMDFVIAYRIIEYASIHFVEHDVLSKINRVISSPRFGADKSKDLEEIAFIVNVKVEENQRIRSLIRKCCSPERLWKEIESNRFAFSKDILFDGVFVQKALVTSKESFETFEKNWNFLIGEAIRRLRNALSHGKDMETAGVITPTLRNLELLRPWVHLITIIAGDVILFKDVA